MPDGGPLQGALIDVDVGAPAHGGSCVARHDGRVVFVRHALPGERVRARITEDRGGAYCRADAVEVLVSSPDRVQPPCAHAGPGRCGGCDWQHASASAQREIKAAIVLEQFARLAGIDLAAEFDGVEALEGGLLGWRSRITFAVDGGGRPGLHRHRSADIEAIEACPLGIEGVGDSPALQRRWPGRTGVEVVRSGGSISVIEHLPGSGRQARGRRPPDRVKVVQGPARLSHRIGERQYSVAAQGFWQVHPAAAAALAQALLDAVSPQPGERVLDLYAGAGALTAVFADAVGTTGQVIGIETSRQAVADAADNLRDLPWAQMSRARVDADLLRSLEFRPDVVVLDPPRAGAGREVMAAILGMRPRAVGYVSCDPASLARDVRVAVDQGWQLNALRGVDAFPMTHHIECVAHLVAPAGRQVRPESGDSSD
ncbi:MAG: TRAM domain-containing protein [Actinomycetota bacterium]|nr:TRAM domain-containing protein [Actinomycetota bacterium]